jgi:hypothetical protein
VTDATPHLRRRDQHFVVVPVLKNGTAPAELLVEPPRERDLEGLDPARQRDAMCRLADQVWFP